MHYVTIFDASDNPFRNLWFILPGFALTTLGALRLFRPESLIKMGFKRAGRFKFFNWFFFLFSIFWTFIAGGVVINDALNAQASANSKRCKTVTGRVEHFHPMPWSGHDTERFDVSGVPFSYSDYIVTAGFNHTSSHGGPIREGLPIRICHLDSEILRLDVLR